MAIIWRIAKWIGIFVLACILAGAIYQQIGSLIDRRNLPPPGRMVVVDNRQIHVLCVGGGAATIVLDSGLGGWSTYWYRIQPALAQFARVCSFDRPGLGWSDGGGKSFDGLAAASEFSGIVAAAQIKTPFVYVGHSLGANFAQIYASQYPQDVAALVLLEPGNPKDMLEDFHGSREQAMALPACNRFCVAAWVAGGLGIARLGSHFAGKSFEGGAQAQYRAGLARTSSPGTAIAYYGALPKTAWQTMDVQKFGDLPVLMLASSELREPEGKETIQDVITWRKGYLEYLASIAAKSSRGQGPIVIANSTHASMVLRQMPAEQVVSAIEKFITDVLHDAPSTQAISSQPKM